MNEMTVPVPDGHLAYVEAHDEHGAGPAVVLLHGGASDHRMWRHQLTALPGHRVIAPDARGHGWSSTPRRPFRSCDDVTALLDALELEQAVLVGLSMGAQTAVDTALEHPGRVAGLVISGGGDGRADFRDPWALALLQRWREAEQAQDAEAWIAAFLEFVPGPHRSLDDVDPAVRSVMDEMVRATLARHITPEVLAGRIPVTATPVPGVPERLGDIAVPVLAVHGGLDSEDHRRFTQRVVDAVPEGRAVTVAGTGHYPNLERPAEFTAALQSFLADRSATV
jgi:pimeloyl-ACP methyl ester carboxylesterase